MKKIFLRFHWRDSNSRNELLGFYTVVDIVSVLISICGYCDNEILLRIMKFSADAESETKFVPYYATGIFHTRSVFYITQ